jgi:hypothetical protein
VQGSLFIAYDYIGFKRRKLAFSIVSAWKTNNGKFLPAAVHKCIWEGRKRHMLCAQEAYDATRVCEFAFSSHFLSFFHLETPRNLKLVFFSFYIVFKSFLEPLVFKIHILVPSCDVLICWFTWFLTTKHIRSFMI